MSKGMFYIFSELLSLLIWRWTLTLVDEPLGAATEVVVAAVVGRVADEVKEGEDVDPERSFREDMDVRVFWNQVFLVAWSSLTAEASWCVRSWKQEGSFVFTLQKIVIFTKQKHWSYPRREVYKNTVYSKLGKKKKIK